jgi:hypothetical protein
MGITSAIFQALGKVLLNNDAITERQSLITRMGTFPIPGALLSGVDFTIYSTKEHSTGPKGKLIRLGVTGWGKW